MIYAIKILSKTCLYSQQFVNQKEGRRYKMRNACMVVYIRGEVNYHVPIQS